MANSKVEIGNMALGYLGLTNYATNLDVPISSVDRELARHYDQVRKVMLRSLKPDFARTRRVVAKLPNPPEFGYAFAYEKPNDFIVILGIGDADDLYTEYNVEGGEIQTDADTVNGLPVRGILDVTQVSRFSPEFTDAFAQALAARCASSLIQDPAQLSLVLRQLREARVEAISISAQENKPIRISRSRWQEARLNGQPWKRGKK